MPEQRDLQKQKGGQGEQQQPHVAASVAPHMATHMAPDQISFYDESLKKQIEGSFTSDGREIRVSSVHGTKSVPYSDLGACIDYNAQVLAVQKMLSELARDPGSGKIKDLQQQKDDQQPEPMDRPVQGHSTAVGM